MRSKALPCRQLAPQVRGPDYFTTGVKVQASAPVFDFVALQLFEVDQPINENIVSLIPNHPLMSPDAADVCLGL
jgi:hypothetical protein